MTGPDEQIDGLYFASYKGAMISWRKAALGRYNIKIGFDDRLYDTNFAQHFCSYILLYIFEQPQELNVHNFFDK